MAELLKEMEDMKNQVVEDYYKKALSSNQFMGRNFEMALRLQRNWRMKKVRKQFERKKSAAVTIQRYIRGYLAYKKVDEIKFQRQNERNLRYFDFHAILIQKVYMGYMSRHYIHSYYKRKKTLDKIKEEQEKTKLMMAQYVKEQEESRKSEDQAKERLHFRNLASKLHHLVSTQTIPGIYNPPYAEKPTAFGQDVESQLKTVFKDMYHTGSFKKTRLPNLQRTQNPSATIGRLSNSDRRMIK